MADIREQIGGIALTVNENFYYGRRHEANALGDNWVYPAIILVEPDSGAFSFSSQAGGLTDSTDLFIQFIDKTPEISQGANYRYEVIQRMKQLAREFIYALEASEKFNPLNAVNPWALLVDMYDVNTAGIELNLGRVTNIFPEPC